MSRYLSPRQRASRRMLAGLLFVVVCMVGLCFAAVPLYRVFCEETGFGGTTQVAHAFPKGALGRQITVRFNADVGGGLDWDFAPDQKEITVKLGEPAHISYHAANRSRRKITGRAIYNVTPEKAGPYFDKIQCFCFTNQELKAGEKVDMPVTFFVDPDLVNDASMDDVKTITLSYTFFEAKASQ